MLLLNIKSLFNKSTLYDYLKHTILMLLFINVILSSNFYILGKYQTSNGIESVKKYIEYYNTINLKHLCDISNCIRISHNKHTYKLSDTGELIETNYNIGSSAYNFGQYKMTKDFTLIYNIDDITMEVNTGGLVEKAISTYVIINCLFVLVYTFLFFNYRYREKRKRLLLMMGTEGSLREQNMRILTENIHHELNTPVAIIRGTLKRLELDIITEKSKNIDLVQTECKSHCNINKKIMTIDFPELNYCLDQIETVLQRMSNFKQIKYSNGNKTIMDIIKYSSNSMNIYKRSNFKIDISQELINYNLFGDLSNGDLMNIISNHLRNSLEANSTRIIIGSKYYADKKNKHTGKLHIFITDNGIGVRNRLTGLPLDSKKLDDVFKPYYSTKDNNGKNKKEHINISGMKKLIVIIKSWFEVVEENTEIRGVGLYLNKQMLMDNGGDLLLRETSDKGTVFEIIISVKETDTIISQKILFEKILGHNNI